jgi:hypothetical protein
LIRLIVLRENTITLLLRLAIPALLLAANAKTLQLNVLGALILTYSLKILTVVLQRQTLVPLASKTHICLSAENVVNFVRLVLIIKLAHYAYQIILWQTRSVILQEIVLKGLLIMVQDALNAPLIVHHVFLLQFAIIA